MTHARRKGSLSRCQSSGRDNIRTWSRGETMGRAWPERFLKEAGLKKRVVKKGQSKEAKLTRVEMDRKHYPLRGRGGSPDDEAPNDNSGRNSQRSHAGARCMKEQSQSSGLPCAEGKAAVKGANGVPPHLGGMRKLAMEHTPKPQEKASTYAPEPRKRRLASLNAEAVNSLLLEKTEALPGAKVVRRGLAEAAAGGECSGSTERGAREPPQQDKPQVCQSAKPQPPSKKPKLTEKEAAIDWSLFAPTPRRLAGLNAAALLKLTSSSAVSKQRSGKAEGKQNTCATAGKKVVSTKTQMPTAKKQAKPSGWENASGVAAYSECRSYQKGGFEKSVSWEGSVEDPHLAKVGYQMGNVPSFPLKQVKEEQVEAELSPYCCCGPPGASLEYCCHRMGLFLRQPQPYPKAEEGNYAPVKQECLVTPATSSLAHTSLALGAPHPCLCADHCFSSYYVHMAHPRAAPLATLGSQPLAYPPPALCPGPMSSSKLLAPSITHSSGIPHTPFCTSVRSPCYSEACRVSSYDYTTLQPVTTRGCSFTTGCSRCRHEIKTEGFSSQQRKPPSSSLLQAPPAMPLSACPLPQASAPSASVPHLLSPLSEQRRGEGAVVGAARECPQGSGSSKGPLSMRRSGLSHRQQTPSAPTPSTATTASVKQKKVVRRRATNGWRPLGVPVDKEVFVVGEDEPVLRQCFEGVRRNRDEIRVRDTVLLRSGPRKKSLPYVAKISALWEDPKTGELMMSLFWYYRPEHTQGGRDPIIHCENEIFASKHQDVNSVACIEDKCYVLPLAQYCRYCALVKRRTEDLPEGPPLVPCLPNTNIPPHRRVPLAVDPDLVYLCRHVYDFRYGRILKNLQ